MKRFATSIFIVGISALFSLQSNYASEIKASTVINSGCKGWDETRADRESSSLGIITYNDGVLSLQLKDVVDQCAAYFVAEYTNNGDGKLTFLVYDDSEIAADCICPFDVESQFEGITEGEYFIEIKFLGYHNLLYSGAHNIYEGMNLNLSSTSGISQTEIGDKIFSFVSEDIIKLNGEGSFQFSVADTSGKILFQIPVKGDSEIDLSSLPKGLFLISISNGIKSESIKFLK